MEDVTVVEKKRVDWNAADASSGRERRAELAGVWVTAALGHVPMTIRLAQGRLAHVRGYGCI